MKWLLFAALLVSSPAHADDRDRSREHFRKGVSLATAGDFTGARDAFAEAYRIFPHPSILLNLGIARSRTGEYVQAEQDLARFLSDDGGAPPEEVASARAALNGVRSHLGTLRLKVAPAGARARLDDRPVALIPGSFVEVRANAGAHTLHVEADAHDPDDRTIEITPARPTEIDLTLRAKERRETRAPSSGRKTAGFVLVGAGVALGGFAAFSAIHAMSLADGYNTRGDASFQDPDTRSTGVTFRTLADISAIVAVASAGLGIYLVVTAPKQTSVAFTVSGLRGTF
jgi:tetratricopeptide (TPR) repeat protein